MPSLAIAVLMITACTGGSSVAQTTPSTLAGALTNGLIAYISDAGVGVLDPGTGKSTVVAPLPAGGIFRTSGPVWGRSPDTTYPVIYFSIHDDRLAERRTTQGVVPYDWLFRVDPFKGTVDAVAAQQDSSSEGPLGMAASDRYVAFSVGCCTDYEVDALDLARAIGPLKVVAKPPAQAVLFTEGAAPGTDGLFVVREFARGGWYFLNPGAGVLNAFPLALGPDDGPVDISTDGKLLAVSLSDGGPLIYTVTEPLNQVPSPAADQTPAATPSPVASPTPAAPPRHLNSKLHHADGLAWSPDQKSLVLAVSGGVEVYDAAAADGAAPVGKYLSGSTVTGVDWSKPLQDKTAAMLTAGPNPQAAIDALLDATKLPAAADTPQGRLQTKVYMWHYDSSKAGTATLPIATVTDPTPEFLAGWPPDATSVGFHHWSAEGAWPMLGGCHRYRVIITGSVPPTASTISLGGTAPCKPA